MGKNFAWIVLKDIHGDGKKMDIENFSDLWSDSKKSYNMEEKFWDERADEFNEKDMEEKENEEFFSILEFIEAGKNKKFNTVLDIGCGTGFYSKRFSEISRSVTAVDISESMLKYAEENSGTKYNNVSFVKKAWSELNLDEFGWRKKFDMVFASMTPAIDSYKDLIKMMDCGTNLYFLSGFVEKKDSLKSGLSEVILGCHDDGFYKNKIYSAFNILWNMGYYPKISYVDSDWTESRPAGKCYKKYLLYFERKKSLTKKDKVSIKEYIEAMSVNGMVEEKVTSKVAWLCWKK